MFRVQENDDGSTVVYCSTSGKQIFVLQPDHQRRIPERTTNVRRPINVVGPSRHSHSLNTLDNETTQGYASDQDKDSNDSDSKDAFPTFFDEESEDYFNESVTDVEFARCLNLVPKKTFENEALNELLKEFPLRLHSRNRICRSKDDSFEEQKYQKLPDDLPLTSNLGVKLLKLNENRNFLTEQKLSLSLKKCDAFCRFPFNSPNPVECNFPKLRCREKKSYPTFISKASKQEATHVYSYGRRQRLERMKTLKTGLDKESRRLFRICNSKKCYVEVNRLDEDEIQYWLSKKTEPILITLDDSDDELPSLKNNLNINGVKVTDVTKIAHHPNEIKNKDVIPNKNLAESVLHSLLATSSGLVRLPKNPIKHFNLDKGCRNVKDEILAESKGCRDCYVRLRDVSKFLYKLRNEYYVKFTKISVPFYADYLASVSLVKRLQSSGKSEKPMRLGNGLVISAVALENTVKKDEITLFPTSRNKTWVPVSSNKVPMPDSKNRALVPASQFAPYVPRTENSKIEGLKIIPYIDLTLDSSPEKDSNPIPTVPKHQHVARQFLFRCYGCGYKQIFSNQSSSSSKAAASLVKNVINEHMQKFHSVDEPEAYLSSYLDTLRNCSIIEAFPGYKGN
ncbi:uncharacterized protein [Parasteatoda tepidariorum]|uniref:uncharacterized protein n=1 Tax=Parasteatoda tepidariorum TaxID=114398 RepID=UPI001C726B86|nr:uncharacterized protein LOC107436084 [Parasteatoda tepidariorum]